MAFRPLQMYLLSGQSEDSNKEKMVAVWQPGGTRSAKVSDISLKL